MPVPIIADPVPSGSNPKPAAQPAQKTMTRAERKELQERQRAAKNAQKQQPQGSSTSAPQKPKTSAPPQKKATAVDANLIKQHASSSKDLSAYILVEDGSTGKALSHGLRIFSHFGLPKPVVHTIKGDIHPAIIRLGLLFSEFKICGANARCIATLIAFKTVCCELFFLLNEPNVL